MAAGKTKVQALRAEAERMWELITRVRSRAAGCGVDQVSGCWTDMLNAGWTRTRVLHVVQSRETIGVAAAGFESRNKEEALTIRWRSVDLL